MKVINKFKMQNFKLSLRKNKKNHNFIISCPFSKQSSPVK